MASAWLIRRFIDPAAGFRFDAKPGRDDALRAV
ncbi:chromate resistance protein ChrB domain-containing protein [Desulfonatronum lacustre]